jgi:hypothetical protein
MFRFIACFTAIFIFSLATFANENNNLIGKIIKERFNAKSVRIHFRGEKFIAKVSFSKDSCLILAGGIGKAKNRYLSARAADLNALTAAGAFIEGTFGTTAQVNSINLNTAFAQKGKWTMAAGNEYITFKLLDVERVFYQING